MGGSEGWWDDAKSAFRVSRSVLPNKHHLDVVRTPELESPRNVVSTVFVWFESKICKNDTTRLFFGLLLFSRQRKQTPQSD